MNKPPDPCADPEIVVGWGPGYFSYQFFNRGDPIASRGGSIPVFLWKPIELETCQELGCIVRNLL